jgi:hypothetical protein
MVALEVVSGEMDGTDDTRMQCAMFGGYAYAVRNVWRIRVCSAQCLEDARMQCAMFGGYAYAVRNVRRAPAPSQCVCARVYIYICTASSFECLTAPTPPQQQHTQEIDSS